MATHVFTSFVSYETVLPPYISSSIRFVPSNTTSAYLHPYSPVILSVAGILIALSLSLSHKTTPRGNHEPIMTACNASDNSDNHTTITAADGTLVPVPQEYVCPLTLDVMSRPLLSREGHSYEQHAILNWVSEHGTSPLTREPLRPSQLVRNRPLETKIRFFLTQHGVSEEFVIDKDDENKFVGYVSSSKQSLSVEPLSLRGLAAVTLEIRPSEEHSPQGDDGTEEPPQNLVDERRRQIANLIGGAMQELDEF